MLNGIQDVHDVMVIWSRYVTDGLYIILEEMCPAEELADVIDQYAVCIGILCGLT